MFFLVGVFSQVNAMWNICLIKIFLIKNNLTIKDRDDKMKY
jgi:hypothetical protein